MSNVFSCTGTIGSDAVVRVLPSGQSVLNVSVANTTGFGDRQQTVWLRVVVWGKKAESNLKNFLVKGQQVFISGELTMSEYKANDGTMKTRVEVNASILDLVGKRNESSGSSNYNAPAPAANYAPQPQQYQQPAAPVYQQPPVQNYAPPPAPNYAPPQAPRPVAAPSFDAPYDDDIPF